MNEFFKRFDDILSLGSNCFIKLYIDKHIKQKETNFFDYIGSSLWSINDLLNNNFDGLFDQNNFEKKLLFDNEHRKDKYVYTNNKYYLRFKHDFVQDCNSNINDITNEMFLKFKNKYERRRRRFLDLIKSDNKMLFIRYEQDNKDRIKYYPDRNNNDIENIDAFIETIKQINNTKQFTILILSQTQETNIDFNNNTAILKIDDKITNWEDSTDIINNTFLKHIKELKIKMN